MPVVFKNPPINEVVIATYFMRLCPAFRSEHVGLFWERIGSDFLACANSLRSVSPMGIVPDIAGEFLPMPRYWFVAEDDIYIIQVQKNAFIFNWRRRKSNEYTRFHKTSSRRLTGTIISLMNSFRTESLYRDSLSARAN